MFQRLRYTAAVRVLSSGSSDLQCPCNVGHACEVVRTLSQRRFGIAATFAFFCATQTRHKLFAGTLPARHGRFHRNGYFGMALRMSVQRRQSSSRSSLFCNGTCSFPSLPSGRQPALQHSKAKSTLRVGFVADLDSALEPALRVGCGAYFVRWL